jgi:hypothetical protein
VNLDKCHALMLGDDGVIPMELRARGLQCVDLVSAAAAAAAAGPDGDPLAFLGVPYLGVGVGTAEYLTAQLWQLLLPPQPPPELLGAAPRDLDAFEAQQLFDKGCGSELRRSLWNLRKLAAIDMQCALQLLRSCAMPRLDYLLRCLPPFQDVKDAAAAFDDLLTNAVWDILAVPRQLPDSRAAHKLRLPLRLGGAGFSPRAEVATVAYLSAVVDTRPVLAALHPALAAIMQLPPSESDHAAAVSSSLAEGPWSGAFTYLAHASDHLHPSARAILRAAAHPPPSAAAAAAPRRRQPHTQEMLMNLSTTSMHTNYLQLISSDPVALARHHSSCGFLGTAWMDAPGIGATSLAPDIVRMELMALLGIPLDPTLPGDDDDSVFCACAAPVPAAAAVVHADSCTGCARGGGSRDRRHHEMVAGVDSVYTSFPGARVFGIAREPGIGTVSLAGKPDRAYPGPRLAHPLNCDMAIDVAVVNPCCDTARCDAGSSDKPGAYAEATAEKKRTDWRNVKRARLPEQTLFIPVVVETYGACCSEFVSFLGQAALGKARVDVIGGPADPGDAGDAGRRVRQRANQYLTAWRRLLSAARVNAVNGHRRRMLCGAASGAAATAARPPTLRLFDGPGGVVRRPGFDESRIYHYVGVRSCRCKLGVEGAPLDAEWDAVVVSSGLPGGASA